jgi:hypothetical protein
MIGECTGHSSGIHPCFNLHLHFSRTIHPYVDLSCASRTSFPDDAGVSLPAASGFITDVDCTYWLMQAMRIPQTHTVRTMR